MNDFEKMSDEFNANVQRTMEAHQRRMAEINERYQTRMTEINAEHDRKVKEIETKYNRPLKFLQWLIFFFHAVTIIASLMTVYFLVS